MTDIVLFYNVHFYSYSQINELLSQLRTEFKEKKTGRGNNKKKKTSILTNMCSPLRVTHDKLKKTRYINWDEIEEDKQIRHRH